MTSQASALLQKIEGTTATIGVVGLGYVGLPLALRFAETGFRVLGLDIDPAKVEKLNAGQSYIDYIPGEQIAAANAAGMEATADFARAAEADALLLCVPTPLDRHREPDLSYVIDTVESLLPHLRPGQLVSLESTTYPGTTDEELLPRIESRGFTVGEDAFLVYSPEREDPANAQFTLRTIPKVVGGVTPACLELGTALYGRVVEQTVPVSSTRAAEMTKLLENIHRAVNVGLVNEMKVVADAKDLDIHEVIDAAATKPFGFVPYYPGPGLGGHCIPIDPFYLTWKAREYGVHTKFIELAGEVNSNMPEWVVGKVVEALNLDHKAVAGSKVLVLGIAYKKNVDDLRESPSLEIMEKLKDRGAQIAYSDPHIPVCPKVRKHHFELESVELSLENLSHFDCVVLATDHDRFDYEVILAASQRIVDARGRWRGGDDRVIKA